MALFHLTRAEYEVYTVLVGSGSRRWQQFARAGLPGHAGSPSTDEPRADVQQGVDLAREIEEADIVKLDNGFFYLANPYNSLRIIDARSMGAPVLAVSLGGMYLTSRRGNHRIDNAN